MISSDEVRKAAAALPDAPGVYFFKGALGEILYIGKASSLRKRVQSYFTRANDAKTQILVGKIVSIDQIPLRSEREATLLEARLIKRHRPHYNIELKDDKSFPFIRITDEPYPVISLWRLKHRRRNDTNRYFGPYPDAALVREVLKAFRSIFGFRTCKKVPARACLYGRLRLCPRPCEAAVSKAAYHRTIRTIILLLAGKSTQVFSMLSKRMKEASSARRFEEAAKIRDQIRALAALTGSAHPGAAAAGGAPTHPIRLGAAAAGGAPSFPLSLGAAAGELEGLKVLLGLKNIPVRIEGFDVSNISGQEACGSMVSFFRGSPDKDNYRRFRIKTVAVIDDYAMIAEVVRRRYRRLRDEKMRFPDLILIDGGRGHLSAAAAALEELKVKIPLMSIAKERESVYVPARGAPISFRTDTPALNLIRRVRDEAHRFAVSYHHVLRRKKILGR